MRCSKCKEEIDDYDVTCPFCGQKTSELYVRDVPELRQKIKNSTPPITFLKVVNDLLCDKKDDSVGTRIFFVFFIIVFIAIFIVFWGLLQPAEYFDINNSLSKLFDSFWSLFGLKPEYFDGRRRGDIRVLITILIMVTIGIRYIAGKDRSEEDEEKK